jgi:hypothetical protein
MVLVDDVGRLESDYKRLEYCSSVLPFKQLQMWGKCQVMMRFGYLFSQLRLNWALVLA